MNKSLVIGITGGSGSGKTYFLSRLMENFTEKEICLISQDNYYHPREAQPLDENGIHNFDTPLSMDGPLLAADVRQLMQGRAVSRSEYTFNNPAKEASSLMLHPAPVIIVEGIFVFYYPEIAGLLDFKIFLETKEYIQLSRRIKRDKEERGYELDDVLYRYMHHVAPTYEKYIAPFKADADIIIPNNHHFDKAVEMMSLYIKHKTGKTSV